MITGGGSGLGRGLVDCFLEEGASIGILELSGSKVAELEGSLDPDRVVVVQGDVRSATANRECVERIRDRFGRLDSLIHCSGVAEFTPALSLIPPESLDEAYREIMDVNVLGPIKSALAAIPELRATGGSIIFTLSTSSFFVGSPHSLYNIAKHALTGVVKQFAYELGPAIRVNAVVPTAIQGSQIGGPAVLGQDELTPEKFFPDLPGAMAGLSPLGAYPTPRDYAPIYLLLADRESSRVVTGSMVNWDSGFSVAGPGMGMAEALRSGAFGPMGGESDQKTDKS